MSSALAVDQPIINDPYQEPTRYWLYESGQPKVVEGPRPAGYYMTPRTWARGRQYLK
jgi:type III restriction enzyme